MKKTCYGIFCGMTGMAIGITLYRRTKQEQGRARKAKQHVPYGPYEAFLKRPLDMALSGMAILLLGPIFVVLTVAGALCMQGNPFFIQERPGKDGKVFKLIKFRTMDGRRDGQGNLLPDEERLNSYGRWLRKTSLDEIPELMNVLKGDMSLVGPRPLLVEYLPFYDEKERHRHDVRPGLTGLSQVNGRNLLQWNKRFELDVKYTREVSFVNDLKILFQTAGKVLGRLDVAEDTAAVEPNFAEERKAGKI